MVAATHEYEIKYSRQAVKDAKRIKAAGLANKVLRPLDILRSNPFMECPRYEALVGDLKGFYSRRINIQHRLVYLVDRERRIVKILRMWTHYEK